MIKVKTRSGFECTLDENAMNDMEVIDLMVDLQSANLVEKLVAYSRLIVKLFGQEGKKKLYDHLRDENGRVKPMLLDAEIEDIFNQMGENGKNL